MTARIPILLFPLALKAQFQELLPLRLNQQKVNLSVQENLVTLAGASPSFCPKPVFPTWLGSGPQSLTCFSFLPVV